ncbi:MULTISPECIES: hypothetical protein [unclassified Roseitalea]|uniref:hypothetical protein n=1 Tax=unclassified Roseitalea TaxID=2639107 RepID=UPI00273EF0BF|nr:MULTISPECIES: hypothetical protein [unclassified Roseitalea]
MTDDKPTADRLRHDIDTGRTGDKVSYPDPAAAPLGTDAEAAGAPPTPSQVDMAHRAETRQRPEAVADPGSDRNRREPARKRRYDAIAPVAIIAAIVAVLILAALAAVLLVMRA